MSGPRFSPRAPRGTSTPAPLMLESRMPASSPRSVLRRPARTLVPAPRTPVPTPPVGRRQVPTGPLAVAVVLLGIFLTGLGLGQATTTTLTLDRAPGGPDVPPPRAFPVLEPSRPNRLAIPAISVDALVHGVGLASDGTVAVPSARRHRQVGWFDRGPTPGQFGPAVLVGHVDGPNGPSVFYNLAKLRPGDRIEVTRRDRDVALFEVNSVEHFDKERVPAFRVHGDFSRPSLRLVTCGGRWVGGGIGYADNIIVFASLVGVRRA
jgi:hypothetical protein